MIKIPQNVLDLVPYKPGKPIEEVQKELGLERVIKLASNENPLGASPLASEAMLESINNIHRYPDLGSVDLREKIAKKIGRKMENIMVGSGSEGVLAVFMRTFMFEGDEAVTSEGTFIGFYVQANARGIKMNMSPMKDYGFDLEKMAELINEKTKVIYLANPNNPTGAYFNKEQFEWFMTKVPDHCIVLLDEAYYEYANYVEDYPNGLDYDFDNLMVLRTFSKIYGIAGIRTGYAVGDQRLIGNMIKVKPTFEPCYTAQMGAFAALSDDKFVEDSVKLNIEGKKFLYDLFDELGITYIKSLGNFVFTVFDTEEKVNQLNHDLIREGVIIRPLRPFGHPNCIRVTVGLPEENEIFAEALRKVL
jgi:histidinol-phosphate aminotransferase